MNRYFQVLRLGLIALLPVPLFTGCLAVGVAKTTLGIAGQAVETTVQTTGAVGAAVIPNRSKK